MPFIFQYLVKLSISLAVIYLFYRLVLRKLTFYKWNRWYLLGYTLLSFIIPFINIMPLLQRRGLTQLHFVKAFPFIDLPGSTRDTSTVQALAGWSYWDVGLLILSCGTLLMVIKFSIQVLSFGRMTRGAIKLTGQDIRVYQVNKKIIPFSFGSAIYLNQELHRQEELKEIIRHEFVHAKQRHTIDIVWSELLFIVNWYNPFSWMIRSAIRQNLEFIADQQVLHEGVDKRQYQYLLLKVIGNDHFRIANQFNFSSLKKRIAMMNKMKSKRRQLLKFFFLLPVVIIILMAFRSKAITTLAIAKNYHTVSVDKKAIVRAMVNSVDVKPVFRGSWSSGSDTTPRKSVKETRTIESVVVVDSAVALPATSTITISGINETGVSVSATNSTPITVTGHVSVASTSSAPITVAGNVSVASVASKPVVVTGEPSNTMSISAPVVVTGKLSLAATSVSFDDFSGEKLLELKIYKSSNKQKLDALIAEAKQHGFDLVLDKIVYNDKSELLSISGSLKKEGVNENFYAADFEVIRLVVMKKDGKLTLHVLISDKGEVSLNLNQREKNIGG